MFADFVLWGLISDLVVLVVSCDFLCNLLIPCFEFSLPAVDCLLLGY